MFVPGCIWQTMHWLEGMPRVNWCLMGCPDWFFGMVGSMVALNPEWPNCRVRSRVFWRPVIGIDDVARAAAAVSVVARLIVRAGKVQKRIE